MGEQFWQWLAHLGQGLAGGLLVLLAAIHPHAAAGAAFGCCFFLAYPSATRGGRRVLYAVFSWGIGYGGGVFWYGGGPPWNQKAMLVSASLAAVAVLLFIAAGSVVKKGGDLPPWAKYLLELISPFGKKRGP